MRKSVSYLTHLRHEVADTAREMHELSIDLEAGLCWIGSLTPEQVRSDKAEDHEAKMIELRKLCNKCLGVIRQHREAAHKLQSFF